MFVLSLTRNGSVMVTVVVVEAVVVAGEVMRLLNALGSQ